MSVPLLLLSLATACRDAATQAAPPDIVLVSLDTTRADAIDVATAPTLNALAAAGTRWSWAISHAPTTASAHASVWTGRDPHGHGLPRNGHPLPRALDTFVRRLTAAGYEAIGVAGASVLSAEAGFGADFRVWDDAMRLDRGRRHEARAADVTDRALARVAARAHPDAPLLLFVHYYDAHAPYDAPAPYGDRFLPAGYAGPYDGSPAATTALADGLRAGTATNADVAALRGRYRGEVAYVDAQLARLLEGLRAHGIDDTDVVVVFGDHGESLADPDSLQPIGHGADVDLFATHVPLLARGPGVPAGAVVDRTVPLRDVGATVLALAGLGATALGEGRSLLRDGAPADGSRPGDAPIFSEATQPAAAERASGWPNLDLERAAVSDRHLLVAAPFRGEAPTLYARDATQSPTTDGAEAERLRAALAAWDKAAPSPDAATPSKDMGDALRALGYTE